MSYYGAHSRMARLALEKVENDHNMAQMDKTHWYHFYDLEQLGQSVSSKFVQLQEDTETRQFIDTSVEKSDYFFTQLFHSIMLSVLKIFMSQTSVNGLLQRGSMFVFSVSQFQLLLDFDQTYGGLKLKSLLDLGAGDGETTIKMAPCFENIYATEMSYTMQWRLQQKGFKVLDIETWDQVLSETPALSPMSSNSAQASETVLNLEEQSPSFMKFDVISCLNLLDRCENPLTLLKKIRNALTPNGRLVVALVLPFKPYVEYNSEHKPKEFLFDMIKTFQNETASVVDCDLRPPGSVSDESTCARVKMNKLNQQIKYLLENIFEPNGFELIKFTKLPYLCEGNLQQSYYYMLDYVFILKLK